MTPAARRGGRGWAYAGAVLGGTVSVAANIAHSYVPPAGAPPDWSPLPGAVVGAVFWPVALIVAIEILARTAWPAGLPWKVIRLGGLLPVAVVAAVVSYRHLAGLIRFYGEDGLTATVGPLAVDGLMIVASAAIIASAPAGGGTGAPLASDRSDATPTPPVASTSAPRERPRRGDVVKPPGAGGAHHGQLGDARDYVLAELRAGRTPSGAAVGRRFGRNSRWGQRLVRDVLASADSPSAPLDLSPASHLAAEPTHPAPDLSAQDQH